MEMLHFWPRPKTASTLVLRACDRFYRQLVHKNLGIVACMNLNEIGQLQRQIFCEKRCPACNLSSLQLFKLPWVCKFVHHAFMQLHGWLNEYRFKYY